MSEFDFETLLTEVATVEATSKIMQEKIYEPIAVGRPSASAFVRVSPNAVGSFSVIEAIGDDGTKTDYLVTKSVVHLLAQELKSKEYHLYVTGDGVCGLWGIRCEGELISNNKWLKSATIAKQEAMKNWIRIIPNKAKQGYEVLKSVSDFGEPPFPQFTSEELLKFAFGDHVISTENHPVIKKLRGILL